MNNMPSDSTSSAPLELPVANRPPQQHAVDGASSVDGDLLAFPTSGGHSGEPAGIRRTHTQLSDEGQGDCSRSAKASSSTRRRSSTSAAASNSSTPSPTTTASDALLLYPTPSTFPRLPTSPDQQSRPRVGTPGKAATSSEPGAGGESVAELRAANMALQQELREDRKRHDDLNSRILDLASQMYKKSNELQLGAHARSI